jgi:hypothetical protein
MGTKGVVPVERRREPSGGAPARLVVRDEATGSELLQGLEHGLLPDPKDGAELVRGERPRGSGDALEERSGELIGFVRGHGRFGTDHCEVGVLAGGELDLDAGRGRGVAVLDVEEAPSARGGEIKARVSPRGEVARASELLPEVGGRRLAHVVGNDDDDFVLALDGPQRAEDRRDFRRGVLVDASCEPHEGLEDDEPGFHLLDRAAKSCEVSFVVDTHLGDVEEVKRRFLEGDASRPCETRETDLERRQCVLGAIEEDGARDASLEASEGLATCGDSERELGGEPGLPAPRSATNDRARESQDEVLNEPASLGRRGRDLGYMADGEGLGLKDPRLP